MRATKQLWAISTGEGPGLWIGWGWMNPQYQSEPWEAFRIALFDRRREARAVLPKVKGPADRGRYPKAKVCRVTITIKEKR